MKAFRSLGFALEGIPTLLGFVSKSSFWWQDGLSQGKGNWSRDTMCLQSDFLFPFLLPRTHGTLI